MLTKKQMILMESQNGVGSLIRYVSPYTGKVVYGYKNRGRADPYTTKSLAPLEKLHLIEKIGSCEIALESFDNTTIVADIIEIIDPARFTVISLEDLLGKEVLNFRRQSCDYSQEYRGNYRGIVTSVCEESLPLVGVEVPNSTINPRYFPIMDIALVSEWPNKRLKVIF